MQHLIAIILIFREQLKYNQPMASLAPDDGDPLYKTDEALSSLLDFVSDVIIQLSEAADQNTQILTFSNNTGSKTISFHIKH